MRVAYQGVRGAYSEVALKRRYGPGTEALGFAFSEQVFDAVAEDRADLGFIPVENSIAGPVGENMDLLLSRPVYAVAEDYLLIEHCLLAPAGTRLADVRSAVSHPVALAQCREFLNARRIRAVPEYDTAGSAELVAGRAVPGEAAIASRQCAAEYNLTVLAEGIQQVKNNTTRFLAFVKAGAEPASLKREKTSLAFSVSHKPGSLLACLKRFADHGINLTRLESRPIAADPFQYSFFVDFLGGVGEKHVEKALDELAGEARSFKVLGSYPLGVRPKSG